MFNLIGTNSTLKSFVLFNVTFTVTLLLLSGKVEIASKSMLPFPSFLHLKGISGIPLDVFIVIFMVCLPDIVISG